MKIQIITLFPEMFPGALNASMLWKAQDRKIALIDYINLRDFGLGKRKAVDDTPYGGGAGMLLRIEPLATAVEHAKKRDPKAKVILMTPRGQRYNQKTAQKLAKEPGLIIICGRYEGYDERIVQFVDAQISVGDFVLTGGEIPAMALIDSVVRLLPGVLGGGPISTEIESFSDGKSVEFPQYTRPEDFRGHKVPEVLLSGNHAEVEKWRQSHKTID